MAHRAPSYTWRAVSALAVLAFATTVGAQSAPQSRADCERLVDYHPASGQEGKDVIWVPTPDELVTRMLRMAGVGPGDYVIDLGAGDGKIAIAAARQFGARALGIEYNPRMAKLAQCLVQAEGVGERVRVIEGDIFKEDFSQADVLTMYLLPALNHCIRHRVLAMRPGVRVVSHQFAMADWEPDESAIGEDHSAFFWVVPARIEGRWAFRPAEAAGAPVLISFSQNFQKIGGIVTLGDGLYPLVGATLHGEELRFAFNDEAGAQKRFVGRVKGREITGEFRSAQGGYTRILASLQGVPGPAPWAERPWHCDQYYSK